MKKNSERSAAMRFTMKLSILLTPFIALLVVYFLNDPFMVLRHYNRYDNSPVMLNEGYIGWQMYMNNRDSIAFDSFIMGNSCTILSSHNHVFPPAISGISNFSFQEKFCQAFFFPNFLFPYLDYKIFHQYRPYMQGVINPYGAIRDAVTNDAINPRERMIRDEGEAYWENHKKEFVKARDCNYRNGEYREGERFLWETQTELLKEIDQICRKHNTSVKIIISPDYNQISINPSDVEILKDIFGYENVFDFSGINEYTNDIHNYYEKGHYRPILGARLLQKVYANHN